MIKLILESIYLGLMAFFMVEAWKDSTPEDKGIPYFIGIVIGGIGWPIIVLYYTIKGSGRDNKEA